MKKLLDKPARVGEGGVVRLASEPAFPALMALIVIGILICLHLLGALNFLEGLFGRGMSAVGGPFYRGGQKTFGFFETITTARELASENRQLREELAKVKGELASREELVRENELLREQLEFVSELELMTQAAEVVGRDPNNLLQFMVINQGAGEGVEEGMAVISANGHMIGKAAEVGSHHSKIISSVDPQSRVAALVQSSRASGVVGGEHGLWLVMDDIPQDAKVERGDFIITSGLEEKIPRGLVIGEVEEVDSADNQLFQRARVRPLVDFRDPEMVFVVLGRR